jgi:hypothetical protein
VPSEECLIEEQSLNIVDGRVVSSDVVRETTITPQLSISQKALGTLPEDSNVMPKHVGANIYN